MVADTTGVHELRDDPAAPGVHCVSDERPAGDLLVGVQTRGVRVALTDRAGLRALANDEPGAGSLGVVLRGKLSWGLTSAGTVAGERRHHEAVGELEAPQLVGREKICHVGSSGRTADTYNQLRVRAFLEPLVSNVSLAPLSAGTTARNRSSLTCSADGKNGFPMGSAG